MKDKIIVISGVTASGKSGLALHLAKKINGVIINADSMQIYKGLPILSAQPTLQEQKEIPHLLYSYLEPSQNCSVGIWLELVQKAINKILANNKTPIVVGGTGMYISKLIEGILEMPDISKETREKTTELYNQIRYKEFYKLISDIDKESVLKLNPNDKHRLMRIYEIYKETGKKLSDIKKQPNQIFYLRKQFFHINLNPPRDLLYKKCNKRFGEMVEEGGLEEVKKFIKNYPEIIKNPQNFSIFKTIGLREIIQYINGEIVWEKMIEISTKITRNYAKRQYTWFRNQLKDKDLIIDEMLNKGNVGSFVEKILNYLYSE
jgi:tRNA dimethylallyltransferase